MALSERFIGLMSGTSLDGLDGVVVSFEPKGTLSGLLSHAYRAFPEALREEFLALNRPGPNELHRAALASNALAELQALLVEELVEIEGCARSDIVAIGSHGQTVRHRPGEFDGVGYTLQLNQGALLAERCGMDVVCDFRSRDVAAGGQGAPLVPAFHQAVFGGSSESRAVLNLGGIANLSVLAASDSPEQPVKGFDCGPGNILLDAWAQRHLGKPFDAGGAWGAGGRIHLGLLAAMLSEPFFSSPPPKSTGRDLFNVSWLDNHLKTWPELGAQDVQATLLELTVRAAAESLLRVAPAVRVLLCCGGGVFNAQLMSGLAKNLPGVAVGSTAEFGMHPMHVEAAAFAWLAWAHVHGIPGNSATSTGAKGTRCLGAFYPGSTLAER